MNKAILGWAASLFLTGCAGINTPIPDQLSGAQILDRSAEYKTLRQLPAPYGAIPVAIYGFRDQTGQYKPQPGSNLSTQVSQGAASMLIDAAMASGWFVALEREGLNNLLTERRIIMGGVENTSSPGQLPALQTARLLFEGGVIAYDSNVQTGGSGARYLGVGANSKYQVDRVTVNLRAVDIQQGRVVNNVTTTKTILSSELSAGVFKYVDFEELLEIEAGVTKNEPAQLALQEAIESAVAHLIAQGLTTGSWMLANPEDMNSPVLGQLFDEAKQSGQFYGQR